MLHKRIISFFLVFAIIFSLPCSIFADYSSNDGENSTIGNIWDAALANVVVNNNLLDWDMLSNIAKYAASHLSSNVCEFSTDGYHHCDNYDYVSADAQGYFIHCTCSDCHQGYDIRTSELPAAYDSYVDDLPVNGITNTGSFVWYPTCADIASGCYKHIYFKSNNYAYTYNDLDPDTPIYDVTNWDEVFISDNGDGIGADIYPVNGNKYVGGNYNNDTVLLKFRADLVFPCSGIYRIMDSIPAADFVCSYSDGSSIDYSCTSVESYQAFNVVEGESHTFEVSAANNKYGYLLSLHAKIYLPIYSVTPDVSALVGHDYSVDTRPSAIITVNDTTIINEDNSTFYNPVTEETYDMREWSYDYSDRSYHVTTNEGDTVTVTYGDENITINQGDTVYNVNYTIPETPVEPHEHNYVVSDSHDATCTVNGSVVYTCSECGLTYSETVPPLGHDWEFVETVAAVEDENGNVTQEAYDLYRCRRCGEERQVPVGSAPASDGENATGFFSWLRKWLIAFKEWLGDKLDKLMGGGGVTNDLDIDDGGDGEEETDPADDPAHSHDDDDGAGWLLWFIRKLTKAGSRAVRGLAGVVFEEALDGVNDSIQGMKDTYGDSGGSVASGGFDIYDSESIWQ